VKIVNIFDENLFAFHYNNEEENELKRLLSLWNDVSYLYRFIKENQKDIGNKSIEEVVNNLLDEAEKIDDFLNELSKSGNLEHFFKQLHNQEYQSQITLSKRKGRKSYLRIYALKIDENCFVVTGGAIKLTHLMEDRPHTKKELQKLNKCRAYLQENDVFDADSFFEFLMENYDE